MGTVNRKYQQDLRDYASLYQWSIDHIPEFWETFWEFAGIIASRPYDQVIDDLHKMPGAQWFPGVRLNFAENLLRFRDDRVALVFRGEGQSPVYITYAELYDETARVAASLKAAGVQKGDRVVGFMPNMPQAIIAMLAASSMGAVWSSCSPDFGIKGVLDRFGQIKPKVLFTADGYFFKGNPIDSLDRVAQVLKEISSIEKVITFAANVSPKLSINSWPWSRS
jgi:acetoacetyl-CoA synthetase